MVNIVPVITRYIIEGIIPKVDFQMIVFALDCTCKHDMPLGNTLTNE